MEVESEELATRARKASSASSKEEHGSSDHSLVLKHKRALQLRLQEDFVKATESLRSLGGKITDAIEKAEESKLSLLLDREKIALKQQEKLEVELEQVRAEITRLEGEEVVTMKRLPFAKLLAPEEETGLENFLLRQTRKFRHDLPAGFLQLEEHLWANEDEIDMVYNREWYTTTADKLIHNCHQQVRRTYIVAGNKGTGKSVFSFVLLLRALKDGLIVAYQNALLRLWIVGVHEGQDWSKIQGSFTRRGYEPALQPGVYICSDVTLFERIAEHRGVMYILDVGDSFLGEIKPTIPKVVISSPNNDKLKRIGEVARPAFLYMPLWSMSELRALNERLPTPQSNLKYVKQTDDELKRLFEIFGGVPRVLFENKDVARKLNMLEVVISQTDFGVWKQVFTVANYTQLPRTVPGMLVHIKAGIADPEDCMVEFASAHVVSLVVRMYFRICRNELIQFLNNPSPSKMISAMQGALVEEFMHERFASRSQHLPDLQIRRLGGARDSSYRGLDLPPMNHMFFRFMNMSDFTTIRPCDYYQPLISNFPAVDAIALLNRQVFEPNAGSFELVGVGFQATVSKKKRKGVPRSDLHTVRDHLRMITGNPNLALYLVFVTVVNGIDAQQRLGKSVEPQDSEFKQFVIRGVSFEATIPMPTVPEELDDGEVDVVEEFE